MKAMISGNAQTARNAMNAKNTENAEYAKMQIWKECKK